MARNLAHSTGVVVLILLVISTGIIKPLQSGTLCSTWQRNTEEAFNMADEGSSRWNTTGTYFNAAPAPITAPSTARLTYDQPRVSTTSGATGIATPYAGGNPTPITAPSYIAGGSPGRYVAPAPAYRAPAPAYQPAQQQAPVYQPPPPPPRPQFAPGGREEFNRFAPEQQQMTESQYLGGDSDYNAQIGLYQKALDDFVRRITGRIEGFETDATQATQGNIKNEGMSVNSLGEDFGARGLSYSGLFDKSKNKLQDRYKEGRVNIGKNRDTNVQNARNDEADYRSENEIGRGNAKRSSLLRMAAAQQLKDAQY